MTRTLNAAVITDLGLLRPNNEDDAIAGNQMIAVADGIGGGPAGELASRLAIGALARCDEEPAPELATDLAAALRNAFISANTQIREAVEADPSTDGMGTTLTAILFGHSEAAIAHIGDSRAYLWRDGRLRQLTKDDTYVQSLVDSGMLAAGEARHHPQKSLITRSLRGHDFRAAYATLAVRPGDRFLVCSDGLSDIVSDDSIERELESGADPKSCARSLVQLALRAGAPDNVTVAVAFMES